nr:VapE domain-containing protein [Nitrosomonas nitrosa]
MSYIFWPEGSYGGSPLPTFLNTLAGVEAAIDVRFNDFTHIPELRASFLGDHWRPINDEVIALIRDFFLEAYRFNPSRPTLVEALKHVAWRNRFNPVADEFRALRWNGEALIDMFFITYGGARDTKLNRAIGRLFWLCTVSGALFPGRDCQVVIIIIAPQGTYKSSMLRIVAGDPSRFTDQELVHLSPERQQEALRGRLIVEASELGGLDRQSVERNKAFISRTHDRARPAWGTFVVDQPRTFTMVGTSNEMQVLRDTTGNRRFLPIETKRFNLDAIRRDREQLLAEAVALYEPGMPLCLPEELWDAAAKRQQRHLVDDPLDEILAALEGTVRKGEQRLSIAACWELLEIEPHSRTPAMKRRIVEAMRRLGWVYDGRPFRIGAATHRGFRRPKPD